MKKFFKYIFISLVVIAAGFSIYYFWGTKHYDLTMRIINFIILFFIIIKYGRKPLVDFLKGKKEEVSIEIKRMEEKQKEAQDQIKETYDQLEYSSVRFEKLKDRIIKQGENQKNKIIDGARKESQIMLEGAKKKIDHRITQAKNTFRSELVDAAIDLTMEKLPEKISDKDNQKLLDQFILNASKKS